MPKDAKKNVDRYKIRGGDLNEFEFHKNQALLKQSWMPGQAPLSSQGMGSEESTEQVKGVTAKNLATKSLTAKRAATKKSAAKKSGTKKSSTKKSGTKKSRTKKSASKK